MDLCDAPPTEEEKKKYQSATEFLLLYYAVLDSALKEIDYEFEQAGLFKQRTKRTIRTVQDITFRSYDALYRKVARVCRRTALSYDSWILKCNDAVDECILLAAPERSFNIAIAMCRCIIRLNNSLGRFIVAEAHPLIRVLRMLEQIDVVPDHHIDNIIEVTLKRLNS